MPNVQVNTELKLFSNYLKKVLMFHIKSSGPLCKKNRQANLNRKVLPSVLGSALSAIRLVLCPQRSQTECATSKYRCKSQLSNLNTASSLSSSNFSFSWARDVELVLLHSVGLHLSSGIILWFPPFCTVFFSCCPHSLFVK